MTLDNRPNRLTEAISGVENPRLVLTDQIVAEGKAYYEATAEKCFEGLIAKCLRSRYRFAHRSGDWVKIVALREEDLVVLGFEKEAGRKRIRSLALGRPDAEAYFGRIGDFEAEEAEALYRVLEPAPRRDPPAGATRSLRWRRTSLRARVRFFTDPHTGRMRHARMRHARMLGWHPGSWPVLAALTRGGTDRIGKPMDLTGTVAFTGTLAAMPRRRPSSSFAPSAESPCAT